MKQEKLWSFDFINYGMSSSVYYMTQYILVTALPIIIISELNGTAIDAGLAMAYFQVGTIIFRAFAGRLVDSFDKRIILFFSTLLFFAIMAAFNFVSSMDGIFLLRGIHGAAFALVTTILPTLIVLVLPKGRKGEGINMFAIFSNVAMVLGPALGLFILQEFGSHNLYIMLTVITLLALVQANLKLLPAELPKPHVKMKKGWGINQLIEPRSLPWAVMALFMGFTYSSVLVFIPIELNSLGASSWASLFFALFAVMIIISRPIVSKLYESKGPAFIIYPGLTIFCLGLVLLGVTNNPILIMVAAPLVGLGYGSVQPAFQALAVQAAPIERAGMATATYFLAFDISIGLGSVLMSYAANSMGFLDTYKVNALIVVGAFLLYHLVIKETYRQEVEEIPL